MTAIAEAVYLPLVFLSVALLGGLEVSDRVRLMPPPPSSLVLAVLLFGVLIRGRVLAPQRLISARRSPLENANGLAVMLTTFAASAQIFNLVIPKAGLPLAVSNLFLFVLLLNTLAGSPDRVSVLRSLAVTLGAAFVVKFVLLAALSEPAGGGLQRLLRALVEGATLGTLTQAPLHPASGYVAFAAIVLFLAGTAMLPSASTITILPGSSAAGSNLLTTHDPSQS